MNRRRSRTLLSLLTPLSLLAAVSGCGLLSDDAGAQGGGRRSFTVAAAGDILMHPELVDQARKDAERTGKGVDGMDFGPMMAGIKPLISKADLAICRHGHPRHLCGADRRHPPGRHAVRLNPPAFDAFLEPPPCRSAKAAPSSTR